MKVYELMQALAKMPAGEEIRVIEEHRDMVSRPLISCVKQYKNKVYLNYGAKP